MNPCVVRDLVMMLQILVALTFLLNLQVDYIEVWGIQGICSTCLDFKLLLIWTRVQCDDLRASTFRVIALNCLWIRSKKDKEI